MDKTVIYAATESAKKRLKNGEYKRSCAKGCACGAAATQKGPEKGTDGGAPNKETPAGK